MNTIYVKQKLFFHVEGIKCYSCVKKIEELFTSTKNVESAYVRFDNSVLEVICDKKIEPNVIQEHLSSIGFKTKILTKKYDKYSAQIIENRRFLNKIAVAGFCAANIMLFTVSVYGGADHLYLQYFSWLTALLFLPVLLYSATDFYKNALTSIKNKYLSIDLPISIALIGGFLFSVFNLILKKYEHLYFDSTASFIFLILVVRYLLGRLQQSLFVVSDPFEIDEAKKYQVGDIQKTVQELKRDDVITVRKNELVPVDGVLLDPYAEVNTSFLTGESYPKLYQQSMTILSGSLNISSNISIRAIRDYNKSHLNQMFERLDQVKKEKSNIVKITDRASHYLVFTVFAVAIGYILFSLTTDLFIGIQRALALVIIACPCALALGAPLAYALGLRKAKVSGILIKDQNVFDRILDVQNLFFDKTGTLTEGKLSLSFSNPELIDPKTIQIILNLERISHHPIAYALRDKWGKEFESYNLVDHIELAGVGVSARLENDMYSLRSHNKANIENIVATLYKNDNVICELYFEDKMRDNLSSFLSSLKSRFKKISLISGDTSPLTKVVGTISGIEESNIFSNLNPNEKYDLIKKYQPALMIGDGINDALALKEAHVGIAMAGAVEASLESSDVYFIKNDLKLIHKLILLSDAVRKTLISNLILSLFYNLIAGYLALAGYINPLVAAVLMPISSLAIILNTYWRLK